MHELTIAENIIKVISDRIAGTAVTSVSVIHVSIGVFSGVEKDSLTSAFSVLPRNRVFRDTTLIVEEPQLVVHCDSCQSDTTVLEGLSLHCGTCGSSMTNIVSGKEMMIERIECTYETQDTHHPKRHT